MPTKYSVKNLNRVLLTAIILRLLNLCLIPFMVVVNTNLSEKRS